MNKNYSAAKEYCEFAAMRGETDAQVWLAFMHLDGLGMPQNNVEAYVWLSIATAYGDPQTKPFRDAVAAKLSADSLGEAQNLAAIRFEKIEAKKKEENARR